MKDKQIQKYEDMINLLPNMNDKIILDVGCGPGWLEEFLTKKYPKTKYIGIDINYKPNIISSGDFLPFKSNTFDIVFCIDTIHLLKNINDMKIVLKSNGILIISEPLSLFKEDILNNFKDLKLETKKIIGKEEKDILLIYKNNFIGPVV